MNPHRPVRLPAGFAPAFAMGIDSGDGSLALVSATAPLPVTGVSQAAPPSLEGTAVGNEIAGPFLPTAGRPVFLVLSGEWHGSVTVLRSTDGGTTRHPLTMAGAPWGRFTTNACEPLWEEGEAGAQLYLSIKLESGALSYRVSQ